jgi:GTP-binding protein Era
VPVSAATGDNVDRLERRSSTAAGGRALYPDDYLTDQPERFFAAEIVREKLLQFTHAEIRSRAPWSIDRSRSRRSEAAAELYCTIVVERESQKPIVVGRGGDMIKRIGTAAREELEKFFDAGCSSTCTSASKSEWREDERVLRTSVWRHERRSTCTRL